MRADERAPAMLEGIRVLDFTQYLAGPTVTRFMAELGATILKIEPAPGGDPSRMLPLVKEGRSVYFIQQNRGKKSVCLDLGKPESLALLERLAGQVDVLVENFGPGVLDKRGLGAKALCARHPRLIYASISAFGRTGPLSDKVGFDLMAQAMSGVAHMTGDPQGPPSFVSMGIADVGAGVHAFGAIAAALFHRERTGAGQSIDISMVDALYHAHEVNVQVCAATQGAYQPIRCGTQHPLTGPYGIYKGPKGWIALLVLERQWPGLVAALGRPEVADDPRFGSAALRGQNRKELAAIVEGWMATFASDAEVLAVLERHRVPAAPVLSVAETLEHPLFAAREMVRRVPDRQLGEVVIPGFPLKLSALPELPELHAPFLGEHNGEVLGDWLGLDAAAVRDLESRGIVASGPH